MSITVLGLSADRTSSHLMEHPHRCPIDFPHHPQPEPEPAELDPVFVFDFHAYDDDLDPALQRWSTWLSVEPLCRGPEPRPDWVVTSQGAIDTELGILKTGKEADVFLVERADPADPDAGVVMAAKRYRSSEHRTFHRAAAYTEGRSTKRSRDERALKRKSTLGQGRRGRRVGGLGVGRAQALPHPRPAGPLPGADRRHRDPDGVDHRGRRDRAAAGPDPSRPGPAGVVLRAAARRHGADGAARRRRTATSRRTTSSPRATGWSSSTCRRSSTSSATPPAWTSCCATARTCAPGSGRAGSTSTSTSCSASCWRTRSERGGWTG